MIPTDDYDTQKCSRLRTFKHEPFLGGTEIGGEAYFWYFTAQEAKSHRPFIMVSVHKNGTMLVI